MEAKTPNVEEHICNSLQHKNMSQHITIQVIYQTRGEMKFSLPFFCVAAKGQKYTIG